MSARTYECPSCGGQADEGARRCGFCRAHIATVRCASCFHMNVAEAGFCSGCGGELGLEPVGAPGELPCPICKRPLDAFAEPRGTLHDCAQCGGQFVGHALLVELLHQREVRGRGRALRNDRGPATAAPVRYVPCPACSALMNRKNFGGTSGVVVDVCKLHGIWFDAGELPRVLAFAESGGMIVARHRELAEKESARAAAVASSAGALVHLDAAGSAEAGEGVLDLLATLARILVNVRS